jgi:hypothetical protein
VLTVSDGRYAFTLLETLLAVLLGGAVVSVAAVVTVQSVSIRKVAAAEVAQRWASARVLDQFEEDVSSAITWSENWPQPIAFPRDADRLIEIVALVAAPDAGSAFVRRLPARTVYRIEELANGKSRLRLMRDVQFVTEPERASYSSLVASELSAARVERYQKGEWSDDPPTGDDVYEELRAVRLVLRTPNQDDGSMKRTVILRNHPKRSAE